MFSTLLSYFSSNRQLTVNHHKILPSKTTMFYMIYISTKTIGTYFKIH